MRFFTTLILLFTILNFGFSQNCGGDTRRGATSGFLDPNADGFITAGGAGFTDCVSGYVDEMLEFEDLRTGCTACETPWTAIPLGTETTGDLWAGGASCGNTEIVPDATTGAYSYFTIIDADGNCGTTTDLMLVFRVRVDASVNGSFSYSLMIDTDGLTGAADPDGIICDSKVANAGFEYEIVANPSNGNFVEVRNIDGVTGQFGTDVAHSNGVPTASYSNTTHYAQSFACRSLCDAGGCDQNAGAVYHTFAIELSAIGKSCTDTDYKFAGSTASSGNGTVSSNTSIADLGGFDGEPTCPDPTIGCNCCTECSDNTSPYYCGAGGGEAICLMGCLSACIAEDNSSATFAIDLLSFEASPINEGIELRWEVATEENNDYYEIERSYDGVNFYSIGRVEGAGTTDQQLSYGLVDEDPMNGLNYYRLKYVDIYGTAEYSTVLAVDNAKEQEVSVKVFPTRIANELNVNMNLAQDGVWDVQVFNLYGQVVQTISWDLQAGYIYRSLDVSNLASGSYILVLKERETSIQSTHRIFK